MIDYFDLLKDLIIKPNEIYNVGNEELWQQFEKECNIIFPTDYKRFINYYGTGGINNFIWFLTPFETDENVNYQQKSRTMLDAYQISKNKFPEDFIYNIFPEENSLLPWGYTDNGDELFWLISEGKWEVVVYESASIISHHYKMGIAEFLYKLLCKEVICDAFPPNLFEENIEYNAIKL